MAENILEIKGLSVEYSTEEATVYAVDDVSLNVEVGETLGLVGETGAGKTTTALSVMGLLPAHVSKITNGSILIDGVDVLKIKEQDFRMMRGSVMSMIFQDPMSSLNPIMTVGAQILEVLKLHRPELSKEELEAEVDRMMEMVGITKERKTEYPHQFSGGMKQRVVIAIALACQPKLILADEPTTALDVTIQAQVLAMMLELKKELNTSMLMITHDLGIIAQTCQKVAVMYGGMILEYGRVEDIFDSEILHPYTTGLFGAIPKLDSKTNRLSPIAGLVPDPTVKRDYCPFAERCPHVMDRCRKEKPALYEVQPGHYVRCYLYNNGTEGKEENDERA